MPYNGTGTFGRLYSWSTDKANSLKIQAARMDAEDNGFAAGLSNCVTKDGQTTTTARVPFTQGVSLGDGTVAASAVNFSADADTGIYRSGADTLDFATGGVNALSLASTGAATFRAGATFGGNVNAPNGFELNWGAPRSAYIAGSSALNTITLATSSTVALTIGATGAATFANALSVTGTTRLGPSSAGITQVYYGTAAITVPALAAYAESTATLTVTGAIVTDMVLLTWNGGALPAGVVADAVVSAAGTVTVRFVNTFAAASSASARTFYATAIRVVA